MQRVKKEYQDKSGLELARICAKVALDAKAEDLVVLDVKGISSFTDYFVIMSGRSTRHVQGLAEIIEGEMHSKRINTSHAEGLEEGMWVLLDFGDVVVHIFYHEQRKFYDLEGLWHDAKPVNIDDLDSPQDALKKQ
jgi:ribosome-associated protein